MNSERFNDLHPLFTALLVMMVTVLLIGGERISEIVNDHGSREPLRSIIDFLGQLEQIQKNKGKSRGGGGMTMLMKQKKPYH